VQGQTAIARKTVDYVESSVPDALAALKPAPGQLNDMAEAALETWRGGGWGRAVARRPRPKPAHCDQPRSKHRPPVRSRRQPHPAGRWRAGSCDHRCCRVEVAQEALTETQSSILPLVPYLDILRWLFIAVALAGIGVAIYARLDNGK
jgi:hypothetical protein